MLFKQRGYKLGLLLVIMGLIFLVTACGPGATPPGGPGATPQIWGLGDVSLDGTVDNADMDIIAQAIGSRDRVSDTNWNPDADLDLNGKVDVADLAIAGRSYGSTHNFHFPRPLSNRNKAVYHLSVAIDASDRLHVVWTEHGISKGWVYYTRLDRFGNTLVDDLLVDSGSAVAGVGANVACDAAGNAYIAWLGPGGLCQARVDQWGYLVLGEEGDSVIDTRPIEYRPAVAVDSSGNAHVHYIRCCGNRVYAAVTNEGALAIRIEGLHACNFAGVIVDADDNVHWLYEREVTGPDPLSYGRYSYGDTPSLPERNITSLQHRLGASSYNRPAMATDASDNAFIIWPDKRDGNPPSLYLEKVAPDGSSVIDDHLLWAGFQTGGAGNADLALDAAGYVHVISPGSFRSIYPPYHLAYGIFDNDGGVISPMRWAVYGKEPIAPRIVVDSQGDAHILYAYSGSNRNLYYQSTAFDAAAYDRSRPDLGVDVAHLNWEPLIARWGQDLEVTAKVFNTGWAASPATKARISIMLRPDVLLPAPAQAEADIPALNPGETQDITVTLHFP